MHDAALARGLVVRTPRRLKDAAEQQAFAALNADVAVIAAYGLILPRPILEAPRLGCLNIHASLLPRWRGAAPIQRAILAGDQETGITIMRMDEGLDTGAILLQSGVPIGPRMNAGALHDALATLGARMILAALDGLVSGTLVARPQPELDVTYAAKLTAADARLDWREDAVLLDRRVRAMAPLPGAWFEHEGERIKVLEAEPVGGAGQPGAVLDEHLAIACGKGALRLLRLQRPGRAAMDAAAFLRGYALARGTVVG
jgi:methionyl-tRNA formyltransferase